MEIREVIEMLRKMQVETKECIGFVTGHVTQAWVIRDLLGSQIKELEKHLEAKKDQKDIMTAKTTKENLCDTCKYSFPECPTNETDIEFGDGIGGDNVCNCKIYKSKN